MQNREFCLLLTKKHYTNPNRFHLCFPIKIKKLTYTNSNIENDLITVFNFFAHWVKERNVTRYGDDVQILPPSLPYEICQYYDARLKHLPEKCLKRIENLLLYSKKEVSYNGKVDRRQNNSNTLADITDNNINGRISKFPDVFHNENFTQIFW